MADWRLRARDIKKYPHFDPAISASQAEGLANDPARVARHAFYPFMRFTQRWNRFAERGEKGKVKERLIRYAARADAYIFSRYRHILSDHYEAELKRLALNNSILAYRRIPTGLHEGGKCNIHFARDAFQTIQKLENCYVVAIDISSFFECLDHARLKTLWCRLLKQESLPADHLRVFRAITNYAVVDKVTVYERLGHFGAKTKSKSGAVIKGYLTPYKKIPMQLCTGVEFRQKIAGGDGQKSLIQKNYKTYGIPQGAPISDLLANLYLVDFDSKISGWMSALGGTYFRYSDDILLIAPGDETAALNMMEKVRSIIGDFGERLQIKREKSSAYLFSKVGGVQKFKHICGTQGLNGLEYLGFRYDGRQVYLRDSTLANLQRKIVRAACREASAYARRYPDKTATELKAIFDYERLIARFGRVEDFKEKHDDYRKWTFWTYANRAAEIFGSLGKPIRKQLRNHRAQVCRKVDDKLEVAVRRRDSATV